jgi:hypothetical protein
LAAVEHPASNTEEIKRKTVLDILIFIGDILIIFNLGFGRRP